MRLSIAVGLSLCATGIAQQCSSLSMDKCATDCKCQRVACCCGAGCDKQGTTVQYNACVPANSPYDQWQGCPSPATCAQFNGLTRTITPCTVPTPAPTPAASQGKSVAIPFGATFPMIGTEKLAQQTWQHNVFTGTTMQFNPGAFFGYTDSYSVPNWNTYNSNGEVDGPGNVVVAPTPIPDATGRLCYSYSQPCPSGYYCKLDAGYNVQQKGACQREAADYWTGGAGKFTDSQYYTGLAHPPLILDPDHNGPATQSASGYGMGYFGVNSGSSAGSAPQWGSSAETCAPLPTGAPVCGYKSFTGTCFCDSDCKSKGDCCMDYAQHCGVLSPQYSGPALSGGNVAAGSGSCDPVGQCAPACGSSRPVTGQNGKSCYCDAQCEATGDCCCSRSQCPP